MTKKITFLSICLFLFSQMAFSQFTGDDIQFWIGEGDSKAYFVADFRDDSTDPSFAWGFRFNEADDISFKDMILAVEAAEPNFTTDFSGGFLDDISYNHHSGLSGEPDWWSTWSGADPSIMDMNSGVSESLESERWYGISYGFSPSPVMPTITYPAYSSLWFSVDEFEYSLGAGDYSTVIVVDFVDDGNADSASYAWKINFDEAISVKEALTLISEKDADFQANFNGEELINITYKTLTGDVWLSYQATDMSNWVLYDLDMDLTNGKWVGLAKGEEYSRRPFTPVPAEENPVLGNEIFELAEIAIYPNPAATEINISISQKALVNIYDMRGALLFSKENVGSNPIDISFLQQGVYIMSVLTDGKSSQHRFIKK